MPSRALQIIRTLYGEELQSLRRRSLFDRVLGRNRRFHGTVPARQRIVDLHRVRRGLVTKKRVLWSLVVGFVVLHVILSIYYYNQLTRSEQDVYREVAQIDSLLQRRRNISINLSRTVKDYAEHEQRVFGHVSDTRATAQSTRPSESGDSKANPADDRAERDGSPNGTILGGLLSIPSPTLSQIQAVAEQYPDLKLSENFRNFMDALVETERELSTARMQYSTMVNTYSTQLKTFPGNLFAEIYGFEQVPYFEADVDAKRFKPVEY
jgi:LemA protein